MGWSESYLDEDVRSELKWGPGAVVPDSECVDDSGRLVAPGSAEELASAIKKALSEVEVALDGKR